MTCFTRRTTTGGCALTTLKNILVAIDCRNGVLKVALYPDAARVNAAGREVGVGAIDEQR